MELTDRAGKEIRVANLHDLDNAIAELKLKKSQQEDEMHIAFDTLKEGLKPINILKSAVQKITKTNTPLELGIKVGGTIAAAVIAKKLLSSNDEPDNSDEQGTKRVEHVVVKEEKHPLSNFTQGMITNFLISHIPTITAYATAIYNNVFQDEEEDTTTLY